MKNSWFALLAAMAVLFSTGQVAAQYGTDEPTAAPEAGAEEGMSELDKLKAMQELDPDAPQVTGARPPSSKIATTPGEAGMGTEAAERERIRRSIGDVGRSVRDKEEDAIPLRFTFHGYYRARYNWIGNAPMPTGSLNDVEPGRDPSAFPSKNASFGEMRLRIDPEVTYGPNPDLPIARLRFTIDGFDNVVWGDNNRVFSAGLFAVDQSFTTYGGPAPQGDGFDLSDSLKLERAWIEFLVPIGQVRVGRMESQWGTGLLTHAGNGLAEWGEFRRGETFDRVLFATRPITLARGIAKGDTRQTPLIFAFVYDRISQDPVLNPTIASPPVATSPELFKPFFTTDAGRSNAPLAYLTNLDRRVSEIVGVLAWFDEDFGNAATDELFAGAYAVYRWQRSTQTRITIPDVAWRVKFTPKNSKRKIAFTTEGEFYSVVGHSGALAFTGGCGTLANRNEACNRGFGRIYNVLGRIGALKEGKWAAQLESGFSSGDDDVLSFTEQGTGRSDNPPTLRVRAFNENVKVGMLMYQVALRALTYDALSPFGAGIELGTNGSVWNSVYFLPSGRITIVPGLEFHAQALVAWASKLDSLLYNNRVSECRLQSDCFMGWELDGAFRARVGAKDIVWIDLEAGVMQPGKAFTTAGFNDAFLWTTQLRAAMIF